MQQTNKDANNARLAGAADPASAGTAAAQPSLATAGANERVAGKDMALANANQGIPGQGGPLA